jgi:hypothetical protein
VFRSINFALARIEFELHGGEWEDED